MPDRRNHRGPHGDDRRLFSAAAILSLRQAAGDYCWLLNRGYAEASSLKLVGDRYDLKKRQRIALARWACSDGALIRRNLRQFDDAGLASTTLLIDGFNVLVTIEAALGGGVVLAGRDGCWRDMASMHGTYRKTAETEKALQLIGQTCQELKVSRCDWLLDRPVSNSGRLRTLMLELAKAKGWTWNVELEADPDSVLVAADGPIATADSGVLDRCGRWFNLARRVVDLHIPKAWLVDLTGEAG